MTRQLEKIKDEAAKQLFKLKVQQLNKVRDTFNFSHPIATETIYLFNVKFDDMYEDNRMVTILHDSYNEFQTKESRMKLLDDITNWIVENGYEPKLVLGN